MRQFLQRTLKREISCSGVGLHSGKNVSLRFCPASENAGIVFQRVDLPGKPVIPAAVANVKNTSRSTTLEAGGFRIQTVEHVLAAIHAYRICNLCIQLDSDETPIGDGSAKPFVELIEKAGIQEQEAYQPLFCLDKPVYFSEGDVFLVALPAEHYRVSYTLHYPRHAIHSQYFSLGITEEGFKKEIASCRTFALYEEINYLMEKGLIQGGSLENAVVFKEGRVLNKEGLRFPDEMARHKVLDLIGDLSLLGKHFLAHVIAVRSGHTANIALGKRLLEHFACENLHGDQ